MKRIKIWFGVLVICISMLSGTTIVLGSIILVAEQAKSNAVAPLHSPVIDANWVLTPLSNSNNAKIPTADGKTIPAAEQAKNNAEAPLHSPVIDVNWVLGPLPNSSKPDNSLDVPLEINREFSHALIDEQIGPPVVGQPQDSGFAVIPEPATLLLFGAAVVMLRRKR